MTRVAGLAGFGRSAAALSCGGTTWVAAEELFSRRKNDPGLPVHALRWLCERAALEVDDLDWIVFAEKPVQRFLRVLAGEAAAFPRSLRTFPRTMGTWLSDRLWLKSALLERLSCAPEKLLFVERGIAKVASAFLGCDAASAAILIVDDSSEWAATTLAVGRRAGAKATLEVLAEIQHPHSLRAVLDAVAQHASAPQSGGLPWLAALGALGKPALATAMREIVQQMPDGAYALDTRALALHGGAARFRRRAHATIGAPRQPAERLWCGNGSERWADLACSARDVVADAVARLVAHARERTAQDTLCLGGSVFLDPGLTAMVLRDAPFARVHVDPHLDDLAAACGAAWYVQQVAVDVAATAVPALAGEPPLPDLVAESRCRVVAQHDDDGVARAASEALAQGKIIGFAQGGPETSARPHGRRVLLAHPGDRGAIARLRREVKLSEAWVSCALLTTAEECATWCAPRAAAAAARAQIAVPVPADVRARAGGAVHGDGTALVHAVSAAAEPRLHRLLQVFAQRAGAPPILAETSMNRAGEPPVLLPAEAMDLLCRSGIDALFWGSTEVQSAL